MSASNIPWECFVRIFPFLNFAPASLSIRLLAEGLDWSRLGWRCSRIFVISVSIYRGSTLMFFSLLTIFMSSLCLHPASLALKSKQNDIYFHLKVITRSLNCAFHPTSVKNEVLKYRRIHSKLKIFINSVVQWVSMS
jgi:hypothetical protein